MADLHLANVGINDFSTFGQLPFNEKIRSLQLDQNNIRDISFLSSLTNLAGLSLDSNQIDDISVLGGLTNLTHLSIRNNNV